MANITRRDPIFGGERTLTSLQRNMDQLFDELFRWSENVWPSVERCERGGICVDVVDRDKDILVKANVPGFEQGDINIEVAEDNLVISGKLEEKEVKEEGKYVVRERPQKIAFERLIPLNAKAIPGKAKATLKNGILEIVIPKAEPTQKKAVKIQVE
ncbi:MAG TPA: Hsp20/alpha crystallin family protein [Thermoanaerobacterales bacterium]|nr:Hsp20/alpha crystallin family protein [Thermoanaerobacterales bacterium]